MGALASVCRGSRLMAAWLRVFSVERQVRAHLLWPVLAAYRESASGQPTDSSLKSLKSSLQPRMLPPRQALLRSPTLGLARQCVRAVADA